MRSSIALCAGVLIGTSSIANAQTFRDWVDVNGLGSNIAGNAWYATTGHGGPMMASSGTSWTSPGYPSSTPLFGPIINIGGEPGAAGTATFNGLWVHPGSGTPAVLVFAPQSTTLVESIHVHAEFIANGLTGNGVTVSASSYLAGISAALPGVGLVSGTEDHLFSFSLGSTVTMHAGDTLSIAFGDNGSYFYDHVNFDAWTTIPAPGAIALFAGAGLVGMRRRRA